MVWDEVASYIDQACKLGAKSVVFSGGGEPFCHPQVVDAIEYAHASNLKVGIITNGLLLDQFDLYRVLKASNFLRVSLNAGTTRMFQLVQGLGKQSFERVLRNLHYLVKVKHETGSHCVIGAGYLTGHETMDVFEMEQFIKVSSDVGLDYAQFRPFQRDLTPINLSFANDLIKQYSDKIQVVFSWQKYEHFADTDLRPYTTCYSSYFITIIGADAQVYSCCELTLRPEWSLGNLRITSLDEIWKQKTEILNKIDIRLCNPFCRGDVINRAMNEVVRLRNNFHSSFL